MAPEIDVEEMNLRITFLVGSVDSIRSGNKGNTGDHGEAKTNGFFDMDLSRDEE